MSRTLTDEQFITEFRPESLPDGSYYRQRDLANAEDRRVLLAAAQQGRAWTCMDDGEGNTVIGDGLHVVNRLYYIITEVPCPAQETITVTE